MEIIEHRFVYLYPAFAKALCEAANRAQQLFASEWFGDVAIRALLFAPVTLSRRILRRHQTHGYPVELGVVVQFASNLKAVAICHYHVEQNYLLLSARDQLFDALGIVQTDRVVAFGLKQSLHQPHLRRRIVDNEYFFLHDALLRTVLRSH